MGAGIVWIERDAETRGDLAVLLPEAVVLDAVRVEMIELPETGERDVGRPRRSEGVERPRDLKAVIVAVGVDGVAELRFPIRRKERGIDVRGSETRTVDAVFPSQLEVFAESEQVRFGECRADRALAAFAAGLGFGRDRPGVLRGHGDVDNAVVRLGGDDGR